MWKILILLCYYYCKTNRIYLEVFYFLNYFRLFIKRILPIKIFFWNTTMKHVINVSWLLICFIFITVQIISWISASSSLNIVVLQYFKAIGKHKKNLPISVKIFLLIVKKFTFSQQLQVNFLTVVFTSAVEGSIWVLPQFLFSVTNTYINWTWKFRLERMNMCAWTHMLNCSYNSVHTA